MFLCRRSDDLQCAVVLFSSGVGGQLRLDLVAKIEDIILVYLWNFGLTSLSLELVACQEVGLRFQPSALSNQSQVVRYLTHIYNVKLLFLRLILKRYVIKLHR